MYPTSGGTALHMLKLWGFRRTKQAVFQLSALQTEAPAPQTPVASRHPPAFQRPASCCCLRAPQQVPPSSVARCRAAFCHLRAVSGHNGTEEAGFALRPRWSGAGGGVPQAVGPHLAPGHVPSAPWGAPPVPQPWVQGCPQSHGGRRRPRRPGLPRPPLTFAGQARATGGAHMPQAKAWRVCIALEEHAPLSRPPPPGGTARRSARSLRARTSGQNLGMRVSEASPLALGSPCSSQPRARA